MICVLETNFQHKKGYELEVDTGNSKLQINYLKKYGFPKYEDEIK